VKVGDWFPRTFPKSRANLEVHTASAASLAGMIRLRTISASILVLLPLAGCGPSANAPVPATAAIAARPDVVIKFDDEHRTCVVALYSEPQGSAVPCSDVVQFLRDELRLPSGAIYDIPTVPDAGKSDLTRVADSLKAAGYRFIGGPHAGGTTGSN
jgi:hypothetical protein